MKCDCLLRKTFLVITRHWITLLIQFCWIMPTQPIQGEQIFLLLKNIFEQSLAAAWFHAGIKKFSGRLVLSVRIKFSFHFWVEAQLWSIPIIFNQVGSEVFCFWRGKMLFSDFSLQSQKWVFFWSQRAKFLSSIDDQGSPIMINY